MLVDAPLPHAEPPLPPCTTTDAQPPCTTARAVTTVRCGPSIDIEGAEHGVGTADGVTAVDEEAAVGGAQERGGVGRVVDGKG